MMSVASVGGAAGGQRLGATKSTARVRKRVMLLIAAVTVVLILGWQLWTSFLVSQQDPLRCASQLRSVGKSPQAGDDTTNLSTYSSESNPVDVPVCAYPVSCRLVLSSRKQYAVAPPMVMDRRPPAPGRLSNATGFIFVVEDGCAMGHLLKDVGVVLRIALWMQEHHRGSNPILYLVFANSCATRSGWERVYGNDARGVGRPLATGNLFDNVLAQWWACLVRLVVHRSRRRHEVLGGGGDAVAPRIQLVFHDEVAVHQDGAWARETHWLFRRPLHWRWFHEHADAATFRHFAVGHCFSANAVSHSSIASTGPRKLAPSSFVTTIVKRRGNRNFHEDAVGHLVENALHAWPPLQQRGGGSNAPVVVVRVVVLETLPYAEQVRLFAASNVVIAAHGAALASIAFMEPNDSIVLELFPKGFGYWLYQELAEAAGVAYQAVHGERVSTACRRKKPQCPSSTATGPLSPPSEDLYAALRRWNGHSACKNCDILWCNQDDEPSHGAAANESECLQRRLSTVIHNAIRLILLKKVRSSLFIHPVDSVAWLDRRS